MKINKRPLTIVISVLAILIAVQIVQRFYSPLIWINLSDSEPLGIYQVQKFNGKLSHGDLVIMNVPPGFERYVYDRGWLPKGWPLLKKVAALPGETYCINDDRFFVNGSLIGKVFTSDSQGLPLPRRITGCRRIEEKCFLPVATHIQNSFDGRYFGAVPFSQIKGIATPILTF